MLSSVPVLLVLALLPCVVLLAYYLRQVQSAPEPWPVVVRCVAAGAVAFAVVVPAALALDARWEGRPLLRSFVAYGLLEEFAKLVAVLAVTPALARWERLSSGLVFGVAVGLGFAAVENVAYVLQYGAGAAALRAVTAVPGHALHSALVGVQLATLHRRADPAARVRAVGLGLGVAVLAHGAYDALLLSDGAARLGIVPLLLLEAAVVRVLFARAADEDAARAIEHLGRVPVFEDAPASALRLLAVAGVRRFVPAGRTVVRAGAPGDALYVVLRGRLRREGVAVAPGGARGEGGRERPAGGHSKGGSARGGAGGAGSGHLPEGLGARGDGSVRAVPTDTEGLGARGDGSVREDPSPTAFVRDAAARAAAEAGAPEDVGPGGFFGEREVVLGRPHAATVTTAEDSVVLRVPRLALFEAVERVDGLAHALAASARGRAAADDAVEDETMVRTSMVEVVALEELRPGLPPGTGVAERLARAELLSALPPARLTELAGACLEVRRGPSRRLVRQGRDPGGMWLLLDGAVDVVKDGALVATLGEGDFFGEINLLTGWPATATVRSVTPVEALVLRWQELGPMVGLHPEVGWAVLEALDARLAALRERGGAGVAASRTGSLGQRALTRSGLGHAPPKSDAARALVERHPDLRAFGASVAEAVVAVVPEDEQGSLVWTADRDRVVEILARAPDALRFLARLRAAS